MYVNYNPNPKKKIVGDCVIRAVSLALGESWQNVYGDITVKGYILADMPSSDAVWSAYIRGKGFKMKPIPDTCPACYTVKDFCIDHPTGTYILKCPDHVVTVIDGDHYDVFDSSDETVLFYYVKEN